MGNEHHALQLKLNRSGFFADRRVDGRQYENEQGTLAWHIMTWPNVGHPIDGYWVERGEFYEVTRLNIPMNAIPSIRIEVGRRIVEMDTDKKDAIIKAINEWEKAAVAESL